MKEFFDRPDRFQCQWSLLCSLIGCLNTLCSSERANVKRFVRKLPLWRRVRKVLLLGEDLLIFSLTLVGYVPIHVFRLGVYRLSGIKIGRDSSFHWRARFFRPWKLRIGNNTVIGNDAMLDARSGIEIGDNVSLSMGVWIWTLQHDPQSPTYEAYGGPVRIEDYAWISTRVTILPGITIGKGAVVAAGGVVTKDVEPYTIVGGVPAKKIGERTKDLRYKLKFHKTFQ